MNLLALVLAATAVAAPEAPKADDVVAAAFVPSAKPSAAAIEPGASNVLPVAGALIALGGLALFLTRRKRAQVSAVRIVESASLGPKRTVTVVELMGERLALAVTEAGVTILSRAPVPLPVSEEADVARSFAWSQDPSPALRAPSPASGEGSVGGFDADLEMAEDAELRRKLAAGLPGVIP